MPKEPPRKKLKASSETNVVLHLDHSLSSPLLKEKIQSNPYSLHTLLLTSEMKLQFGDLEKPNFLGCCPKYGLILKGIIEKNPAVVLADAKTGHISHQFKLDTAGLVSGCVELGKTDYIVLVGNHRIIKMSMSGDIVWEKTDHYLFTSVVRVGKQLIVSNWNKGIMFLNSEDGKQIRSVTMDHPFALYLAADGLYVLCSAKISMAGIFRYESNGDTCIMVLEGKNYSNSYLVADLKERTSRSLGMTEDGDLIVISDERKVVVLIIDSESGRIKLEAKIEDYDFSYLGYGKYLLQEKKTENYLKLSTITFKSEHFPSVWNEEIHEIVKKRDLRIPYCCNSIMVRNQTIPKSLLWFIKLKWGDYNWIKYETKFLETPKNRPLPRSLIFCTKPPNTTYPDYVEKWLESNHDGIIVGGFSYPKQSMYYIASKMSECNNNLTIYLIDAVMEQVISLPVLNFLSNSTPILGETQEEFTTPTIGVMYVDYLGIYNEMKKKGVIQDGKIDSNILLKSYQKMTDNSIVKLSQIPYHIQMKKLKIEGGKFLCRDLIVLSLRHNLNLAAFVVKTEASKVDFTEDE